MKRISVVSGSSTLNDLLRRSPRWPAISSRDSGGRVSFLPVGSPIIPVKSPIRKMHRVPEILEVPHLVEQHGVAKVQVRRRRIETQLDAQRPSLTQLADELRFGDQLLAASLDQFQRLWRRDHRCIRGSGAAARQ